MEEYKVFDEYLKKCQSIRAYCEERERMLFESIRIGGDTDGKIRWLNAVGAEIEKVQQMIVQMAKERVPSLTLKE